MTVIRDFLFVDRALPVSERPQSTRERSSVLLRISTRLRLWCERNRQRQELVMLIDPELRDIGVPRDLVMHEARKWPWQRWHPQLQGFDEAILRRIAGPKKETEFVARQRPDHLVVAALSAAFGAFEPMAAGDRPAP
jgi:uncharacterized protein YjiS (DUF1127 family)